MGTIFEIREYFERNNSPFADWFNPLDAVTAAALINIFAALKREISERQSTK